jgi:hypothetical protein
VDLAETAPHPGFTPRGLAFTIALSVGFHLLILWRLSDWYQAGWDNHSPFSRQRPLLVTVTAPRSQETEHQPVPSSEPVTDQSTIKKPTAKKEVINEAVTDVTPPHAVPLKQTTTGTIRERTVTTAQIKQSVATVVRDLADDDEGELEQKPDPVSATLDRALNKPRETPGIYSQANGTTRVVTEQGFTYCVKAPEDWRIIDPEDDMRVSTNCN